MKTTKRARRRAQMEARIERVKRRQKWDSHWGHPRFLANTWSLCSRPHCCGNPRRIKGRKTYRLTMQELKHGQREAGNPD